MPRVCSLLQGPCFAQTGNDRPKKVRLGSLIFAKSDFAKSTVEQLTVGSEAQGLAGNPTLLKIASVVK